MKKLDVKSLIIGVLAILLIFVLIGATNQQQETGRYQITATRTPNWCYVYVVDTKTGVVKEVCGIEYEQLGKTFYEVKRHPNW